MKRRSLFAVLAASALLATRRAKAQTAASYTASGIGYADAETPVWSAGGFFVCQKLAAPLQSLQFYRNGLLLKQGVDYTVSSPTGTGMLVTPLGWTPGATDTVQAFYRFAPTSGLLS